MNGFIYKLICPIDGSRKYIGQTIQPLENRQKRYISKTKSIEKIGYRKTSTKYNIPRSTLKRWIIC